jgi:myxalamid-type polyketide synthase MxaB
MNDTNQDRLIRAYQALEKMQARLETLERAKTDPIAIIGMGCRFPGHSDDPDSFWQMLTNGTDAITEVPKNRWNIDDYYDPDPDKPGKIYTRYGGFLEDIDSFDAAFFGISPREAATLDPQQRLILEVAYQALENAGLDPKRLSNTETGVFLGIATCDYAGLRYGLRDPAQIDAYFATGSSLCMGAGRLSYTLGLTGPSMVTDTACSSSLVSVHLACQSLRNKECSMALTGGVNVILKPELSINFCKAKMLSPDGHCKTFDASADGYVRGEGCGIVVLKRLSDAIADKDPVFAIIRGSAVNQDGASAGLTVPNGISQENVIRKALAFGNISPEDLSYIEAHGTGTSLGDPIEVEALGKIFCTKNRKSPLLVGSVKTNIGHTEAAAGIAGLIKTVLSLYHGEIPPHLHFRKPNPKISWDEFAIKIPTNLTKWDCGEKSRIAGVSAFGASGTNAHIVVEEAVQNAKCKMQNAKIAFKRQKYPIRDKAPITEGRGKQIHPLVQYRLYVADTDKIYFESRISENSPKYLSHHRVYDVSVIPATAYLEMALAAGSSVLDTENIVLESVSISQPIILAKEQTKTVQIVLTPEDSGVYSFQIFSINTPHPPSMGDRNASTLHVTGKIRAMSEQPLAEISFSSVQKQCDEEIPVENVYQQFQEWGINYGSLFQGMTQVWQGKDEALGKIRLPDELLSEAKEYYLHPALSDACFHAAGPAFPQAVKGSPFLPIAIERLELFGRPGIGAWSHAKIRQIPDQPEILNTDLNLFDDSGALTVRLTGLSLKKTSREALLKSLKPDFSDWLSEISWQPVESPLERGRGVFRFLIIDNEEKTGEQLAHLLKEHEAFCNIVSVKEVIENGFADQSYQGIVYLRSTDTDGLLLMVQKMASVQWAETPRLWVITKGAQAVGADTIPVNVHQCPIWGMGLVIASEHPEFQCTCVDIDSDIEVLADELLSPDTENRLAFREGVRYRAKMIRYLPKSSERLDFTTGEYRVNISEHGVLDNLHFEPLQRKLPKPDEVEIRVRATGLNFRDVLNALGMLKGLAENIPFGFECAGQIVSVGENVKHLKIGDAVIAVHAIGSLAGFVSVRADFVTLKPANLNFEQSASLPGAFLTAYYALYHQANIRQGDRILIHAAAGGVGMAAVRLAQQAGAEIFATASPGKWDFLRSLGIQHIMNSRNTDFAEEIKQITGGQGVNIVLNSLSGDFIPKSLEILKSGGTFVEIGKIGILSPAEMRQQRPDISYCPFDLNEIAQNQPDIISSMMKEMTRQIESGQFAPLPHKVFHIRQTSDAFRYMAQAKHIGKIVISHSEIPLIRSDGIYLITGGLGALGLRVSRWLAEKGARHLLLIGRHQPSESARKMLDELEISVKIEQADVANYEDMARVFGNIKSSPLERGRGVSDVPLRGIFHLAGILEDALLIRQTPEQFQRVMAPKAQGAWNLHVLTQNMPLDMFVCFSSIASVTGSAGQSNYAAANAFLDGLAHHRRALGLHGLSINWGPWAESGMAARVDQRHKARWSVKAIEPSSGLDILEHLLKQDAVQVGVIIKDTKPLSAKASSSSVIAQLNAAPVERRYALLEAHVRSQIAKVLDMPTDDQIEPRQRLFDAGIDSLMSVELKNRLEVSLERPLRSTLIFDYPTTEALTNYLAELLNLMPTPDTHQDSEDLSQDDIAILLEKELAEIQKGKTG